jgi:mannosyltransferase PIG-V
MNSGELADARLDRADRVKIDWLSLLALGVLMRALMLTVGLTAGAGRADPITTITTQWVHWDAVHYLNIAVYGYGTQGEFRNQIAFFPYYPGLIRALTLATGLPVVVSAIALSTVGSLAATILLYEIGRADGDASHARYAAVLFTVFPTAYFLLAPYSEGVYCAFAFGAALAVRRRGYWLTGLLGQLAAGTRLTGLALLPMVVAEAIGSRERGRRLATTLVAACLIPIGFAMYLIINGLTLHDPLAFVGVQRARWYHSLSAPWSGFLAALRSISWRPPWEKFTVGVCEAVAGLGAYLTVLGSWLRLRPGDVAYAAALTVLVTFLPFWLSIPRYLLGMYPLFLLGGQIRHPLAQVGVLTVSIALLLLFTAAYTRGYWAF